MAELEKKWYVIRCAGGKEKKAKEYIESEIRALGLNDYVSQILIPTEKIYQVRNGIRLPHGETGQGQGAYPSQTLRDQQDTGHRGRAARAG